MPFCTKCGQQNNDTTKFCTKCGTALTRPFSADPGIQKEKPVPAYTENKEVIATKKSNLTRIILAAVGIILIGTGAWYFFIRGKDDKNKTGKDLISSTTDSATVSPALPGRFPQASARLLTESELSGIAGSDLKIMRNEIYARHGYIFSANELREYFVSQNWYHPQYNDVSGMLSDLEKSNIALLKRKEEGGNINMVSSSLLQLSPASTENIVPNMISSLSQVTEQFFTAGDNEDITALLNFFSFPVKHYYEVSNYGYDALKRRYERYYHEVLSTHKMNVNWNSSYVSKIPGGFHLEINTSYTYTTKKNPDNIHNLTSVIVMNLDQQFKIYEMYEPR